MHRILLREVVIDVPAESFEATRAFWSGALDTESRLVEDYPEFTALTDPAAACVVGLQRLDSGPPRLHLDVETDDVPAEVDRLVGLGATVVGQGRTWTVLQDPAGLVFCVVPAESEFFPEQSRAVG